MGFTGHQIISNWCQEEMIIVSLGFYYSILYWLQNQQQFILHFQIHIDILKLCRKFEVIPTSIFQVTAILRKRQKIWKTPKAIVHEFFEKNCSEITSNF